MLTTGPRATKLVIFDCDGVLVDSEALSIRVLAETMRGLGFHMTQAECYREFLGRSLTSVTSILRDKLGRTLTESELVKMRERLYELYRLELKPVAGIEGALGALGIPFCVASSSQPDRIRLSLDLTGLAGFFGEHVFSATMVANGKPAPDLFLHAALSMGQAPQDCVVIEDSPAGIEAASRADMRSFAFLGGSHAEAACLREAVAPLRPCRIFERMEELPQLLAQLEED